MNERIDDEGANERGNERVVRRALVRALFRARVAKGMQFLSQLTLLVAIVASAVLFSPAIGVLFALAAVVLWSGAGVLGRELERQTEGSISVDDGVLVVTSSGEPRRVVVYTSSTGRVTPDGASFARSRVVVRNRRRVVLDAVLDRADARAVLRDAGLSARERPMTFAFFFGLRVTVGADGILVAWPLLRRRRFVRYADIVDVATSEGIIVIRLRDGRTYEIATSAKKRSRAADEHAALLERIDDAREAYRSSEESGALAAALARGGRSARAWVKELAAMSAAGSSAARGGGYRSPAPPKETLWRIALDPTETEELRIGAGLTLRGELDDEGRDRLRAAAEASASPRVRVALAGAADLLDDDALGDVIAGRVKVAR